MGEVHELVSAPTSNVKSTRSFDPNSHKQKIPQEGKRAQLETKRLVETNAADSGTSEKFFLPLRVDGRLVNSAFHDSGAVVTCIGREMISRVSPRWMTKFPEVESIPLVSHTNHSLKVIGARLVPLSIPGTDIELVHPVHVEQGGRDLVIGRDLIIRCKIGLEWQEDEKLVATLPSPSVSGKIWEIPVFQHVAGGLVTNVEEVTLEGGEEKLVKVVGKGRAEKTEDNDLYLIRGLDPGRDAKAFVIDTVGRPQFSKDNSWRSQVLIKNLSTSPLSVPATSIKCTVGETCKEDDLITFQEIDKKTAKGAWFRNFADQTDMHCLIQDVSKTASSGDNKFHQSKIDLAEVTDLDAAEAHEGGFGIDEQTHDTCLLYTSPSPRDKRQSRMPSSA